MFNDGCNARVCSEQFRNLSLTAYMSPSLEADGLPTNKRGELSSPLRYGCVTSASLELERMGLKPKEGGDNEMI